MGATLKDSYSRTIRDLRVSVTDRLTFWQKALRVGSGNFANSAGCVYGDRNDYALYEVLEDSLNETPLSNRSAREHSPPIARAATSITQGPRSFTRSSACTGPVPSPP